MAYATQNNKVILGELCDELLSLVHQVPYILIARVLTGACRVAIDGKVAILCFTK